MFRVSGAQNTISIGQEDTSTRDKLIDDICDKTDEHCFRKDVEIGTRSHA